MVTLHNMKSGLDRILKKVLVVSFFCIFSLVVILVVLRYVFNSTLVGGNELITLLFVYTTMIGAAVSVGHRDHISVTVLIDKLPISFKLIVDALVLALVGLLNAAMVWYSLTVWVPITGRFIMPALQLPQVYAQLSVPIGCSLAVLYCFLSILDVVDGFTQKNTVS